MVASASAARRQPDEHVGQQLPVDGRLAPEGPEERLRPELVDHVQGVHPLERHEAEHHVGQGLGQDPSDAEHHGHAELGIPVEPGDELPVALHHRRHQQRDLTVVRAGRSQQVGAGTLDRLPGAEVETDQPPLGLVGDPVAVQLHDDREPQLGRRRAGRRSIGHDPLLGDGHAVRRKERLRRGLGEGSGCRHGRAA